MLDFCKASLFYVRRDDADWHVCFTHRVKWRHISEVAMRSPFCRSTRRTVCS